MSKVSMAKAVRQATDCTQAEARKAVDAVLDTMSKDLKKNGKFVVPRFGTFRVSKFKRRAWRVPATGEKTGPKAPKTVRFKASPALRKRI